MSEYNPEEREKRDASLVILMFEGKVLLILRDDIPTIASPNMWAFPGGLKEENETFEETAKRELFEELNITATDLKFVTSIDYEGKSKQFFATTLREEQVSEIILTEGQKYEFFTLKEAQKLSLAKSTKMFLEKYPDKLPPGFYP